MGAGIALLASARLQQPGVRFCVLGTCLSANVRHLTAHEGKAPCGRVLAIREASDESTAGCAWWDQEQRGPTGLVAREVVLKTGLKHGFLYQPLSDWVNPVVEWAGQR
jgi:hypothetical protein